jgi:hypothetical protein
MIQQKAKKLSFILVFVLLVLALPNAVTGLVFKGEDFPDELLVNGETCKLMGVTSYKLWHFFTVQYGGFYLSQPTQNSQVVIKSEQTKLLVVQLRRDVEGKKYRDLYIKEFAKILDYEATPEIKGKVDQFLDILYAQDYKKRDVVKITYFPGQGTEVEIKGDKRPIIHGRDFMMALYTIWFGPESRFKSEGKRLLGIR